MTQAQAVIETIDKLAWIRAWIRGSLIRPENRIETDKTFDL